MSNTLFTKVDYSLDNLISYIEIGDIGLPDLQRPFVWTDNKVRELFDSVYRGYPIGNFLFWQNITGGQNRTIGTDQKQKEPRLLVVDGQQRLTSMYAVIKSVPVVRANHTTSKLVVSFNPLTEEFRVSNDVNSKDKKFLPDISVLSKS